MTRQQLSVDEKLGGPMTGPSIPVPSIWTSLKPSAAVMFNQVDDIGVPRGIKTLLTLRLHSPTSLSHKCTHLGARKRRNLTTLTSWRSTLSDNGNPRNAGADGKDPSEGNKLDAMTYQEIHFSKCVNVPPVV
ncbi:hypothetical protein LENED_006521 [Lentinula edodes]|uniref:Uncharacterized protein n=1 Tax=Lentinula edodes TaxID=5353 RepID=A0A1Q3EBZ1_LENED|nr:hypothetical protein LENED_006521 [Lentinula edodes]